MIYWILVIKIITKCNLFCCHRIDLRGATRIIGNHTPIGPLGVPIPPQYGFGASCSRCSVVFMLHVYQSALDMIAATRMVDPKPQNAWARNLKYITRSWASRPKFGVSCSRCSDVFMLHVYQSKLSTSHHVIINSHSLYDLPGVL